MLTGVAKKKIFLQTSFQTMVYNFGLVSDRIRLYNEIQALLSGVNNGQLYACLEAKVNDFQKALHVIKRIGSKSVNGEAFVTCTLKCQNDKCSCTKDSAVVALKKYPIRDGAEKYANDRMSPQAMHFDTWAELAVMKMCRELVFGRICPNLPVYMYYSVCESCRFENVRLKKKQNFQCINMISEFAVLGDFKKWTQKPRGSKYWWNAYFQIYAGLHALQLKFNVTHNDLHPHNVLVHSIPRGNYWRYVIGDSTYDVPNLGYLFVLWDFGYVESDVIQIDKWKGIKKSRSRLVNDYWNIAAAAGTAASDFHVTVPLDILSTFQKDVNDASRAGKKIEDLIRDLWGNMYPSSNDHEIIEVYNMNAPLIIQDKGLRELVRSRTAVKKTPK